MVAVNWGPGDAGVYAGPVMSHYEFQLGLPLVKPIPNGSPKSVLAMPHPRRIGPAAIGSPGRSHSPGGYDRRLNEFSQVRVPSVAG